MDRKLTAIMAADVVGYSRLMSADESGTLAALQSIRAELIAPAIAKYRGRIVKLMGDGLLAEFPSVVDAVACAAEIQTAMPARNAGLPPPRQLAWRIGVHLGDVIVDGDDIYGDGVNIAARLEGIAETGGICISRQAFDQVDGKLPLAYRALGPQALKNMAKHVEAYAVIVSGDRPPARPLDAADQEIRYCRAPDGIRLAYATLGHGPPLVKSANWLNHLEYDWKLPGLRHLYRGLAKDHTLVRYDARGNGMSDWDVGEISLEAWVSDLETVVDAAGAERFPLFGLSQGCAICVAYAVRHPERVSHLILYGGFPRGRVKATTDPDTLAKFEAMTTLMRVGWGSADPTFRQLFTSQMMPDATKEQMDGFNELQRQTTSAECAARYFHAVARLDVADLLDKVRAPTLVLHARDDRMVPVESGRALAAGIPGARFIAIPGRNHVPLDREPLGDRLVEEIGLFLAK